MDRTLRRAAGLGWGLVAAVFLLALVFYAWIGSFMRYMGDDYCYGMILSQKGFWQAQWFSYLFSTPYTGDRFSLTLFSDLFHLFGSRFNGWLPGLTLAAWVAGMAMVLRQLNRLLKLAAKPMLWLAAAAAFVFFVLYQAPDLAESFYWRSGMLPYTMPLLGDVWLAAWLLALMQKEQPRWSELLGVGLLAAINAGFSETAVALQAAGLGIGLFFLVFLRMNRTSSSLSLKPVAYALAGTGIAMAAMLLSPSNTDRLNTLPESLGLIASLKLSLRYAFAFAIESLRGLPVPSMLSLGVSAALGFELADIPSGSQKVRWQSWLGGCTLAAMLGLVLLASSMAPSVFIQTWYPEPRALIVARFVLELTLFCLGGLTGWYVRGILPGDGVLRLGRIAALVVALACAAYALRGAARPLSALPEYRQYAAQWDQRDALIRQMEALGVRDVIVIPLAHPLLQGGDISEDAGHWYNQCAAGYYGIDSLKATP